MAKKYREVRKTLKRGGWSVARQAGSHEIWVHLDGRAVTVAGKESDTVPVGILASIRRTTGLDELR